MLAMIRAVVACCCGFVRLSGRLFPHYQADATMAFPVRVRKPGFLRPSGLSARMAHLTS